MSYVFFHQSNGLGAKLIRARNRGWANHVSVVRNINEKIVEATSNGGVVQRRTISEAVEGGDRVRVFTPPPVSEVAEELAWTWLLQQIGKGYDHPGLLGFLPIPLPFGLSKAGSKQDERKDSKTWFCSELVKAWADKRGTPLVGQLITRPPRETGFGVYYEPYLIDPEWLMSSTELVEDQWLL